MAPLVGISEMSHKTDLPPPNRFANKKPPKTPIFLPKNEQPSLQKLFGGTSSEAKVISTIPPKGLAQLMGIPAAVIAPLLKDKPISLLTLVLIANAWKKRNSCLNVFTGDTKMSAVLVGDKDFPETFPDDDKEEEVKPDDE